MAPQPTYVHPTRHEQTHSYYRLPIQSSPHPHSFPQTLPLTVHILDTSPRPRCGQLPFKIPNWFPPLPFTSLTSVKSGSLLATLSCGKPLFCLSDVTTEVDKLILTCHYYFCSSFDHFLLSHPPGFLTSVLHQQLVYNIRLRSKLSASVD